MRAGEGLEVSRVCLSKPLHPSHCCFIEIMTQEEPTITTVQVYSDTKQELKELKERPGDSYDDTIRKLIQEHYSNE